MTISPNLEPININLPKDMIYSRVLLGVDRVQTLDNINLKSELKDIATKLISNSTYSIIQSAGTSGVKSEYAKADNGTNDAFSYVDIQRRNWDKKDFENKYLFGEDASALRKVDQTSTYFSSINSKTPIKPIAAADTKFTNLNDYAYEKTIKTSLGDVEVFLDLYNDNDKLGIGKLDANGFLFNFDSNKDGVINSGDKYFDKLKVRGYDKDGNEKIFKLSEVVSEINLNDFIKKDIRNLSHEAMDFASKNTVDYRVSLNNSNPYTLFSAEYRYQKIDKEETNKFFKDHADKDGWVDLRDNKIFNEESGLNNFAYEKVGFDGKKKLSEFNPIIKPSGPKQDESFSYAGYQKDSFMKFYNDYQKESSAHIKDVEWISKNLKENDVEDADDLISKLKVTKSSYIIAMESEFEKATGLEFSLENLERAKHAFESDTSKAAAALKDTDSVIAMKLNKNGTITLKFDSGRELEVKEIYSDTGKLISKDDKDSKRASINLDAKSMNDVELNRLDFKDIGIKKDEKISSLKELGAKLVKNLSDKFTSKFLIGLENGKSITTKEIYNITYLENDLKFKELSSKDRLYKKVDTRV